MSPHRGAMSDLATGPLGGHLPHILLFAAWVPVFAVLWLREQRGRRPLLRRDPWVIGAAAGLVVAAATHFAVMPEHFRESPLYGWFFLLAGTAQVAAAVLVVVRPRAWILRGALIGSVLVAALWLETRVVGVPLGPGQGDTEPVGALDMLATGAELVTAVCAWAAVQQTLLGRRAAGRRRVTG
jgi:hypothetical protein